jgi:outer membrane lipoprotein-sorting protein
VNVSHPNASAQQSMNPYNFLTLYKKGYTITSSNAASGTQVHLVGKGKSISEMYILVDKNYNIKEVKFLQKGTWVTIHISNLKNQTLDNSVFTFNAKEFPQAEIIDMR